jgi:hypothetical protein
VWWAADNGCFGSGYPGDAGWLRWLERLAEHAGRCLFATAPDVVGHAAATLARSAPHLPTIRGLGYPAALVAQDGLEELGVPWATFDVLFIGGSTAWKLGPGAAGLVGEARQRGKPVHMGRVNTRQRWRYADYLGLWANTRAGAASYEVVTRVTAVRSAATPATDVPDGDLSPWCSHPRSFAPGPDAARCRSSHQQCATTRRQRGAALDATGPA